jgi:hypothetical protein
MNIESKLWKIKSVNGAYVAVIQKASGKMAVVYRSRFPSDEELAAMHERKFDSIAREVFHNAFN